MDIPSEKINRLKKELIDFKNALEAAENLEAESWGIQYMNLNDKGYSYYFIDIPIFIKKRLKFLFKEKFQS